MPAADQSPAYRICADAGIRVHVSELACCALEIGSAIALGLMQQETDKDEPARVDVLLVSGSVTDALAPAVAAQWQSLPEPRLAVAVGACASSGGPYWNSISVRNGIGDLVESAGFIAGCPPDPRRIVDGVIALVPHT